MEQVGLTIAAASHYFSTIVIYVTEELQLIGCLIFS
jgi:hypothetical protein